MLAVIGYGSAGSQTLIDLQSAGQFHADELPTVEAPLLDQLA
jgi:hypothetical protein